MGLTAPSAVVGSTDPQILQFLALANRVLRDLVSDYEWRRLVTQKVYQTTASATVTGTTTADSAVVTSVSSTASLSAGMVVSGTGIPAFATIVSVDSGTQFTMDMAADTAGTGTTITYAVQDFALPDGFDRMVSKTNFNRSQHWANIGPKSSQEWQWLQSGNLSTSPRFRYRIYHNKLRMFPAPTSVLNMVYEYVSQYSVIASGGTAPTKAKFTVDSDTCVFPDDVMVLGLKFQWYRANGLDYATPLAEFNRALSYAKGSDEDNPTLNLAPSFGNLLVEPNAVPEGSWPGFS